MTPLHPGTLLDHFQVENLVARSGMASIFKATDTRNGRTVALKIPHPEMEADPLLFDRFKREQEIGEKLDGDRDLYMTASRLTTRVVQPGGK